MALRRRIATAVLLAAGVAAALSVRLSRPELHTDEVLYMSRVLESMIRGSALPLEAAGHPFVNKPPLALWMMRLSFAVLEPGPLAARLPSVLAAVATAAVLYLFAAAFLSERVPVDRLWPEEAQYRGLTGRLWEIAHRDPGIGVMPAPASGCPASTRSPTARHASSSRPSSCGSPAAPGTCRAILLNDRRAAPEPDEALELHPPGWRGIALFLQDDCNGWLRRQLDRRLYPLSRPSQQSTQDLYNRSWDSTAMTLTLDLPPELEEKLAAEATRLGLPLAEYALRVLAKRTGERAPATGADLVDYWQRENLVGTRPDIAESARHAREARARAEKRVRA